MLHADVAIVGCGPVGATLANLLGRRGVSVIVVEKQAKPYDLPRAIHFDGEAMRVFQAAGLAEHVLPSTMVGRGMLFKDTNDNVLIDWSRDQNVGAMGWYESYRVHSPGLERALRSGLERFDHISLLAGVSVTGTRARSDLVELCLSDARSISAKYVVGCDGAASQLRTLLGIDTYSLGYEERWLVVDLILKKPREDLGDYSVQYCDIDHPATYVRGVGDRRRWEMRLQDCDLDDMSDALVWDRLQRWIEPHEAELERSAVYTFRSCISRLWQSDRVFLAGDAAHQMPPFMGQGMCAGIRDAANIAWKLQLVLSGEAGEQVLRTYQTEREYNVRQFIELSVRLGRLINQTASGEAPQGQMNSIWPCLGPGLGVRDGVSGELAPQIFLSDGQRSDDIADGGFYVLARSDVKTDLPIVHGNWTKLDENGCAGAVIRPDGYALMGVRDAITRAQVRELLD